MENSNKIGKILKDIEDIDIIKELKRKLRRKKDLNSTCASEQVAQLFYDLIQDLLQKGDITTQSHLLSLVEYFGKVFISLDPVQFCIGNTLKKILHIIREEINESKKDKKLNLKEQKELIIKAKNNIKKLKDFEIFKTNKNNEINVEKSDSNSDLNSSEKLIYINNAELDVPLTESNKSQILDQISILISEIHSISETITEKKEIKDLIKDDDIILTTNYSEQILKILIENKKTKKFKVFVCESAPKLREKSMAEELAKRKMDITIISDDDIYSVMRQFTKVKVFLGAKAILVNGGLITYGGAYNICLSASLFSNPVIIVGGTTKLTPMYSFKHELYNEYLSPDLIFGKNMEYKGDISNIQFNNPSLDYVPPNLISMYATDIGILNPKFLYKHFNDMYDLEDYEI